MGRLGKIGPTRFRAIDLLVLAAAAFLVLQPPLSLAEAAWVPDLQGLGKIAVAGLIVGYLVERTRLWAVLGLPLGVLLGIEAITYVFAQVNPDGTLSSKVDWLGTRVGAWADTIASGGVSNDPLVFAVAMGALAWILGLITGWLTFRDNAPWLAIIINGIALLMNLSYAPQSEIGYVTTFTFAACLLLVAQQLANRTELWRRAQLRVPWRIVANVLVGTALAVFGVLSVAWALPANLASPTVAVGWGRITAPWLNLEGEFDRWFAAISGSSRNARGLSFGRTLAPRGAFDLGDTPVLQVKASGPLYLRATTADRYAGQAITSSETGTADEDANTDLLTQDSLPEARAAITAQIKVLASRTAVGFAPDAPMRFNVATEIDTRGDEPQDIAAVRLTNPVQQNQEYSVVAAVSVATNQELRAAGEVYPDWVRQRYLQLPRRLPRRVIDLARSTTEGATNALDKATDIEQYLRTDLTYSTHVPSVPTDRDWVDYFLFDSKEGYCDYFATAMVVLLRVEGVPARVASGFAPGDFDPDTGIATVKENHAHSWVEAYFPRYGWITFEPSAIRPVPTRLEEPETPLPLPAINPLDGSDASRLTREELDELLDMQSAAPPIEREQPFLATLSGLLVVALGLLLGLGAIAALIATIAWQRGLRGLALYQRPYVQLLRLGGWVGSMRTSASVTPFELADSLARQVPSAAPAIREVTAAYVEGTYGTRPPRGDPWPVWIAARRDVFRGMVRRRLRRWLGDDGAQRVAPRSRPELLRELRANRRTTPRRPRD